MLKRMGEFRAFFDGDNGGAGGSGSVGDPGTGTGTGAGGTGGAGAGGAGGEAPKTFTQEQVNSFIAREKGEALKGFLKELGIDDVKTGKEALAKYKEIQEGQKTEVQKLTDQLTETGKSTEALARENAELKAKLAASAAGISADKIDKVVKLAGTYEGKDDAERIAAVIKEFPELVKKPAGKDFGGRTGGSDPNEKDALLEKIRAGMKSA